MKKAISFFLILFYFFSLGQAKKTTDSKEMVYNISLGAVVGAVGALVNKKKDEDINKVLFKGLYQGALGGYLTFESKRLVKLAQNNEDWKVLWSAKIVNAAGTSIKENAGLNRNFWEHWHINFGFNRLDFHTKDTFKIEYKVMPVALYYTVEKAVQSKFELKHTLQTGELVFSMSQVPSRLKMNVKGQAFPGGIILYGTDENRFSVISHEIIHIYQFNDFSQMETIMNKPILSIKYNGKFLNKINRHIHYDTRYIPNLIFYYIEDKNAVYYYDNRFEREAGFYSNTFNPFTVRN
ncbi:MAG: hypothetical protein Q4G16_12760 [Cruoricaptor ignavus]|nr:hypothetical protein [Cruoricaptor ignavus]